MLNRFPCNEIRLLQPVSANTAKATCKIFPPPISKKSKAITSQTLICKNKKCKDMKRATSGQLMARSAKVTNSESDVLQ